MQYLYLDLPDLLPKSEHARLLDLFLLVLPRYSNRGGCELSEVQGYAHLLM